MKNLLKMPILCHSVPFVLASTVFLLYSTFPVVHPFYDDYSDNPISFGGYYGFPIIAGVQGPQTVPLYIETSDNSQSESDSSSEESTEKQGESGENGSTTTQNSVLQSRFDFSSFFPKRSKALRYLMLDRKCLSPVGRGDKFSDEVDGNNSMSKSNELERRKRSSENCWVDLRGSENREKNLWVEGEEIKVLVHGYTFKFWNSADNVIRGQGFYELAQEYGNDTNVMVIDWTVYAATSSYPRAARKTRLAGEELTKFLVLIQQRNSFSDKEYWGKMHLVGFSLGAHVCGIVGHLLKITHNVMVNRITGLDPAGPGFDRLSDPSWSLDQDDAVFVDVIHCNMGHPLNFIIAAIHGLFGTWFQRGMADFYPNGGERQSPLCDISQDTKGCSHGKCMKYFIESIRRQDYHACKCSNWERYTRKHCPCKNKEAGTIMGEHASSSARGKFYLTIK